MIIFKTAALNLKFIWLRIKWNYHHFMLTKHKDAATAHYKKETEIVACVGSMIDELHTIVKGLDKVEGKE